MSDAINKQCDRCPRQSKGESTDGWFTVYSDGEQFIIQPLDLAANLCMSILVQRCEFFTKFDFCGLDCLQKQIASWSHELGETNDVNDDTAERDATANQSEV